MRAEPCQGSEIQEMQLETQPLAGEVSGARTRPPCPAGSNRAGRIPGERPRTRTHRPGAACARSALAAALPGPRGGAGLPLLRLAEPPGSRTLSPRAAAGRGSLALSACSSKGPGAKWGLGVGAGDMAAPDRPAEPWAGGGVFPGPGEQGRSCLLPRRAGSLLPWCMGRGAGASQAASAE